MCHLLSLLRNEPSLKLFTLFAFTRTKILYSLQKLIFQEHHKLDHALFRISFFNSLIKVLRIFLFLFAMKYIHFYNQLRWSGSLILINLPALCGFSQSHLTLITSKTYLGCGEQCLASNPYLDYLTSYSSLKGVRLSEARFPHL